MKEEYHLVSKSRPLLAVKEKDSSFNLNELKLLDLYLSRINPLDPNTSKVVIKLSEYCSIMGIDSMKVRPAQLKKYTKNFLGNVVTMPSPISKGSYIQATLFTVAFYNERKARLKAERDEGTSTPTH